ncbi:MAG: radical SAM protein [Oscillospiraceae bacterium]|nr:radical SAM protein [Oscillospiraceae bacterium]
MDTVKYAEAIRKFTDRCVIREADGGMLSPEQAYRFYENKRFRMMLLSITGYCNSKCKHCFNAADHNARNVQPETAALLDLIGRLDDCGVAGLRITGGEPLLKCSDQV